MKLTSSMNFSKLLVLLKSYLKLQTKDGHGAEGWSGLQPEFGF